MAVLCDASSKLADKQAAMMDGVVQASLTKRGDKIKNEFHYEPHDERTLANEQDLLLIVRVFLLLLQQHLDLLQTFECERDFVLVLNQLDTTEAAHAKCPHVLQVAQLHVTELGSGRRKALCALREHLIHDSGVADRLERPEVCVEGAGTDTIGSKGRIARISYFLSSIRQSAPGGLAMTLASRLS